MKTNTEKIYGGNYVIDFLVRFLMIIGGLVIVAVQTFLLFVAPFLLAERFHWSIGVLELFFILCLGIYLASHLDGKK